MGYGNYAFQRGEYEHAIRLLHPLAEQGNEIAQFNLAQMYREGNGVAQDYEQALLLYLKAADQAFAPAQINLGVTYYHGFGVKQNYEDAFKWYSKAAEQGDLTAQFNLAEMYYNGKGVTQNSMAGAKWLNISTALGLEQPQQARDFVKESMTEVQVQEARRLAGEWLEMQSK